MNAYCDIMNLKMIIPVYRIISPIKVSDLIEMSIPSTHRYIMKENIAENDNGIVRETKKLSHQSSTLSVIVEELCYYFSMLCNL